MNEWMNERWYSDKGLSMNYVMLQGAEGDETVVMSDEEETEGLKYHDIIKILL